MSFLHPLRSLCRPSAMVGKRRARPYLETLEDRTLFSVNLLSNFKSLDTNDAGGIVEPPDPIAAAGPTPVVEVVNSNIAFYNKTTGALGDHPSLFNFFGDANGGFSLTRELFTTTWRPASRGTPTHRTSSAASAPPESAAARRSAAAGCPAHSDHRTRT